MSTIDRLKGKRMSVELYVTRPLIYENGHLSCLLYITKKKKKKKKKKGINSKKRCVTLSCS
jgi:hypothetical protein